MGSSRRSSGNGSFLSNNHWVSLLEASVLSTVSQTFGEPVNVFGGETIVVATVGSFALFSSDEVVDVVGFSVVEDAVGFGNSLGKARLPGDGSELWFSPSSAPLVFVKGSRVFKVAPWIFPLGRWLVATFHVVQAIAFSDTVITAFFLLEVGWQVSTLTIVGGSATS